MPSMAEVARNLSSVYRDFQSKKVPVSTLLEVARSSDVIRMARLLINKESVNPEYPFTANEMDFVHTFIEVCQYIYEETSHEPPLTDSEYDILYAIFVSNSETEEFAQPIYHTKKNIVHHKYPNLRGTLKKAHYLYPDEKKVGKSRISIDDWLASKERYIYEKTGVEVSLKKEKIYVFPKWDGVSAVLEIDDNGNLVRALTRGDTSRNEAQDITEKLRHIPIHQHKMQWEYGLKVEVVMSEENKDKFNHVYGTNYKNSRSIVSAILMTDEVDPDKIRYLEFRELRVQDFTSPIEYLADDALRKDPYITTNLTNRDKIKAFAESHRFVDGIRCDGAVIQFASPTLQKSLGRENDINNFEVAYKFTAEITKSVVTGVQFQIGVYATVTPVIQFEPREMKGNTIRSASLGSIARFKDMDLHVGDVITVHYDIIPYVVKEPDDPVGERAIPLPTKCPMCGAELTFTEAEAFCSNKECPSQKIGSVLNYVNMMGIEGISYQRITRLIEAGILGGILDLYHLKDYKNSICEIHGFGPLIYEGMVNGIDEKRTVKSYRFMSAIGIGGYSLLKWRNILKKYRLDDLLNMEPSKMANELCTVPGIGKISADDIVNGIMEKKDLIKELRKEVNVIDISDEVSNDNLVVCFHLIRDKDLEKEIEDELNGRVVRGVTKATTHLVVPDDSVDVNDAKTTTARNNNIPVLGITEFRKILGEMHG